MQDVQRLPLAALLTAGAGVAHAGAAVPHFVEAGLYGTSFLVLGWVQLAVAAALLVRPTRGVAVSGAAIHLVSIAAWGFSRTVGLPLSGHGGPEAVGLADTLTVALEAAAVAVIAARLSGWRAGLRRHPISFAAVMVTTLVATSGSAAAIADLSNGHDPAGGVQGHAGATPAPDQHAMESSDDGSEVPHRHEDGSWHLHTSGGHHAHGDGTTHVHVAVNDSTDGVGSADQTAPSGDADHGDGPEGDHGH